jgi:hypothetical protein
VAKIILMMNGTVLQEMTLSKERISIGRRPHNDIILDNLPISAEHAVIVTILNDSFLEDLNSTNGTQINGQPVKKHFLRDGDVIQLAEYQMRYVADEHAESGAADNLRDRAAGLAVASGGHGQTEVQNRTAMIKVLNGVNAGKQIALAKVLTTIGHPGVQVAVITRGPQGYNITHVEGEVCPLVNGQSVGTDPYSIVHGDVIDLSGTQMTFLIA